MFLSGLVQNLRFYLSGLFLPLLGSWRLGGLRDGSGSIWGSICTNSRQNWSPGGRFRCAFAPSSPNQHTKSEKSIKTTPPEPRDLSRSPRPEKLRITDPPNQTPTKNRQTIDQKPIKIMLLESSTWRLSPQLRTPHLDEESSAGGGSPPQLRTPQLVEESSARPLPPPYH